MQTKVVKKSLIAQQDMLMSTRTIQQVRGGKLVNVNGIGISFIELWRGLLGDTYAGTFEDGCTLTAQAPIAVSLTSGQAFSWGGTLPHEVRPTDAPWEAGSGYVLRNDAMLKAQLASQYGSGSIGATNYDGVRAYTGPATRLKVYGITNVFDKGHGDFVVDPTDTTTPDNLGTVLVDKLGRRWKRQFDGSIRICWWQADYTGKQDASWAFQHATVAAGSNTITVDGVYRIASPTGITKRLVFKTGAKLIVDTGVVCLVDKRPDAPLTEAIFDGKISSTTPWSSASIDWFSPAAYGFGGACNAAFNVSKCLTVNQTGYEQGLGPVIIPQGANCSITGRGFRQSAVTVADGAISISYVRADAAVNASSLTLKHLEFIGTAARTAIAIKWFGYFAGTPGAETAIRDDNWMRVEECVFTNMSRGTWTKFAGQCHFNGNMALYSACMHYKERGSSFHYHNDELALAGQHFNGSYIYGEDPANDAYSNGLFINQCNSVTSAGIDIRLRNWQAVFIDKGGYDLGSLGPAALWFASCQDVQIDSVWVASTLQAAAANRYGVHFENCRNSNIGKCTIVNNKRGINSTNGSAIGVSECVFEGNLEYDIADTGMAIGWAISSTRHRTVVSSGMPIWLGGSGAGSNTVVGAIMKQATHTIPLGTNSANAACVFGAALS